MYSLGAGLLAAFALWTAAVRFVDVRPIGPDGTSVGFAALNGWFHALTGVHPVLYRITDWLSLVPLAFAAGFALLGLAQWIKRKNIVKVDRSILVLGGFYAALLAVYLLFEKVIINFRPVWIEGVPEVSYPSSTTLLVLCVMSTAALQLKDRIRYTAVRRFTLVAMVLFSAFMVLCRLVSGVHWVTDIIGGVLLSAGLVVLYGACCETRE